MIEFLLFIGMVVPHYRGDDNTVSEKFVTHFFHYYTCKSVQRWFFISRSRNTENAGLLRAKTGFVLSRLKLKQD